ncbi:MAG: AAA family ATPase [Candidatus Thorarchaeota archaeon]
MEKKNFLICLTGLPASGKSTFANRLKELLEERLNEFKVKIIDPDKIREKLVPGEFDHSKEQKVRNKNLELVKKALELGFIVISDDLNYFTSMRHELKNIAEKIGLKYFIIHISTPIETCIKWNEKRSKPIPNIVISNIYKKFDDFSKYKWDIPLATYDLSKLKDLDQPIEKLIDIIIQNLKILKERREIIEITAQFSNIDNERLDKVTRKIVGNLLRNPKYRNLKNKIIKYRKIYVKMNINTVLIESDIETTFKQYLEKSLNIKIS